MDQQNTSSAKVHCSAADEMFVIPFFFFLTPKVRKYVIKPVLREKLLINTQQRFPLTELGGHINLDKKAVCFHVKALLKD